MPRVVAPLIAGLALALFAAACGGGDDASPAPAEPAPAAPAPPAGATEPLPGLPDYTAGYRGWTKLNDAPIPPAEGGDPHQGTKDVFTSAPRGADGRFPDGTIVVKESTREGEDFVHLVAAMRKVAGSAPDAGDWEFVEWTRGAADAPFAELASGQVCVSCHMQVAESGDWAFTGAGG